ncbi:MAG: tripartite tricarboxylate transporter TctB family protein [Burkholderiales bacterium]|nr:tripartite tricarboxylate transporter TctB family protein [Burkholderiales bacterium]MDE2455084.1 tripartite tricarboxylate transporter TctB family protein [Burkholderiales bacterium]
MNIEYRDLIAGLLFIALGAFVALYASGHYTVGDPARMGPGFFPVVLGWALAALGAVVTLLALRRTTLVAAPPHIALRPLLAVPAAIGAFGLIVEPLGLVPATLALTAIVVFAERPLRWRRTLLLAACLAVISWLIFLVGLQMTLPAFKLPG